MSDETVKAAVVETMDRDEKYTKFPARWVLQYWCRGKDVAFMYTSAVYWELQTAQQKAAEIRTNGGALGPIRIIEIPGNDDAPAASGERS